MAASARALAVTGILVAISVLFLGDSITAANTVGVDTGYVELLAERHPDWQLGNAGIGAATADAWATNVAFFDPTTQLDAVVLLLGTNDAIGQFSLADYMADMLSIEAHFVNADHVFMLRPPPIGPAFVPNAQPVLETYWEWLAEYSPDGADFSDFDYETFDSIQVHPLQEGHDLMADRVEVMLLAIPEPLSGTMLLLSLCVLACRQAQSRSASHAR